jgi:FAD/FMN-containing dehydrogenase
MSFGKIPAKKADKRKTDRIPSALSATIVLANGEQIRCVVKNFSKTGALLTVASVLGIPAEFDLQASRGPARHVTVVRRTASQIAVRYA